MLTSQLSKLMDTERVEWNITELVTKDNFTLVKCNSKQIYRYGYDLKDLKLYVTFRGKNRDTYTYQNVPKELFEEMNLSKSKGTFLNTNVKKRFNYQKRIDITPL